MPLNNVARAAIEELRGLGVSDLTPDEVVRLNDLGAAQIAAGRERDGTAIRPPVRVGSLLLRPPTLAAEDFVVRFADFVRPENQPAFFPWILSHDDELDGIQTADELNRALRRFRRACRATRAELEEAVESVLGNGDFENAESLRNSILRVAAFAAERYPGFGATIREKCLALLREAEKARTVRAGSEGSDLPGYGMWRKIAIDLAVMTGIPVDVWYREDTRSALIAYRRAWEVLTVKGGGGTGGTDGKPPPELVRSVAEMRREIALIYTNRKERNHGKRK